MTEYSTACRNCALGLLDTARKWKARGNQHEVNRLAGVARWYWRRYLMTKEAHREPDILRDLRPRPSGDPEAVPGNLAMPDPQADRGKQLRRAERLDRPRTVHAVHGN